MALTVVGLLLFLSTFVTAFTAPEDPPGLRIPEIKFENGQPTFVKKKSPLESAFERALIGFGMILVGSILMNLGAKGIASSGLLLDPQQARKDLQPWSKMAGGMVQDAVSEIDVSQTLGLNKTQQDPVIKVRCQRCQTLNDEAAKFCDQCGTAI